MAQKIYSTKAVEQFTNDMKQKDFKVYETNDLKVLHKNDEYKSIILKQVRPTGWTLRAYRYLPDKYVKFFYDVKKPKEQIKITCYGTVEFWYDRKKAIQRYTECVLSSEGSEQSRYAKILAELNSGCTECSDEYWN